MRSKKNVYPDDPISSSEMVAILLSDCDISLINFLNSKTFRKAPEGIKNARYI